MGKIQIHELSPGEAVLSAEKIAKYRQILERGEQFDPVEVYKVDGWLIVRDGNNRVRAHIEHFRANVLPLEAINCTPSIATAPSSAALDGLHKFSCYYGQGADAFVRMPVATNEDYESTQIIVMRQIISSELDPTFKRNGANANSLATYIGFDL